jgi:hypothetical protein
LMNIVALQILPLRGPLAEPALTNYTTDVPLERDAFVSVVRREVTGIE